MEVNNNLRFYKNLNLLRIVTMEVDIIKEEYSN